MAAGAGPLVVGRQGGVEKQQLPQLGLGGQQLAAVLLGVVGRAQEVGRKQAVGLRVDGQAERGFGRGGGQQRARQGGHGGVGGVGQLAQEVHPVEGVEVVVLAQVVNGLLQAARGLAAGRVGFGGGLHGREGGGGQLDFVAARRGVEAGDAHRHHAQHLLGQAAENLLVGEALVLEVGGQLREAGIDAAGLVGGWRGFNSVLIQKLFEHLQALGRQRGVGDGALPQGLVGILGDDHAGQRGAVDLPGQRGVEVFDQVLGALVGGLGGKQRLPGLVGGGLLPAQQLHHGQEPRGLLPGGGQVAHQLLLHGAGGQRRRGRGGPEGAQPEPGGQAEAGNKYE